MVALLLMAAAVMGLALGLLGGGGSILTLPLLMHGMDIGAREAIAASLAVVGITSLVGLVQHARKGNVRWAVGLGFAAFSMAGAWLGGWLAAYVPAMVLLGGFILMMVATGVAMLRGRKDAPCGPAPIAAHVQVQWGKVAIEGLLVGAVTGLVGAGGGFLVVPALTLLGGLSMRHAVGTSLLVIALKSAAGLAGHAMHVEIPWDAVMLISGGAVAGAWAGAVLSSRISPDRLRRVFAIFVLVMAVVMTGLEVRGLLLG